MVGRLAPPHWSLSLYRETMVSGGQEVLRKWWLRSEQQTIAFGCNGGIDAFFVMALIRAYYTNSLPQR